MKKKLTRIFMIVILILLVYQKNTYGFIKKNYSGWFSKLLVIEWSSPETSDKVRLNELRDKLGYHGDKITKEMVFKTYIKITKVKGKKYSIQFRK